MTGLPTVHLVHFYSSPGGIEILSSRLLSSFSGYLFRVFVIRPAAESQINVYEGTDVPVCYGSRNNMQAMLRLWRYARRHSDDVFHLFNLGPFFLMTVRLAGAKRIIYSIHGTRYWKNRWQRALHKPVWKMAVSKNVTVTSNSEYSKSVFLEKVSRDAEIRVIYNPISSGRFVPSPVKRESGLFKIVYAGRLNTGKNLDKWIDVAVDLHGRLDRTIFEIYGSGPLFHALNEKIRSCRAEDYITLKGYRSDIENVFRDADLLLFLSEYESFGNVVVESILCGTPVIASDIPAMREIFRDYPLFLVSPEEDLAGQIADRLKDYHQLAEAVKAAEMNFRERFSEAEYINSLDKIYFSQWLI